jgi:hypothetical protein
MMRSRVKRVSSCLLLLGLLLLGHGLIRQVSASSNSTYTLDWMSTNSAATSGGGSLRLTGAAGVPESGEVLRGGSYSLEGGFVGDVQEESVRQEIYLPLVIRAG